MLEIERIIYLLESYYKKQLCAVNKFKSPYQVLISCLISLRTKDEITEIASEKLFKKADTPLKMIKLNPNEISKIIYPAGFYKRKGVQIFNISKKLVEDYGGNIPDSIEELLQFKGVGRKTANLVLGLGFNIPAICVDIHVHRISNRLGLVSSATPEGTELQLMDILPEKYWIKINHLMVLHGRHICKPVSPKCSECFIKRYCNRNGVEKSR